MILEELLDKKDNDIIGDMMNFEKVVLEGDLFYVENFLTQEELDFFKPFCDDHEGWYTTMRSPYRNILNKFIENNMERRPDGSTGVPTGDEPAIEHEILKRPGGVLDKLTQIMPPIYRPHATLQTFKYCTDEEIERDLNEMDRKEITQDGILPFDVKKVDWAMNWHSEWDETSPLPQFNRSLSVYLNDDFEGGELVFKYKPYVIKPKAGMFVSVPVTKEFTHRVNKITSGNWRHTLYGASWNKEFPPNSTEETC